MQNLKYMPVQFWSVAALLKLHALPVRLWTC